MSTERRGIEIIVGLFLLIGLSFIAVMVVMFGRVGQGATGTYPITVEFPDAQGLIQNSDVKLSGALIGHVAEAPRLLGDSFRVAVKLNIREDVRIPRQASFIVGSSGLLGDRFVEVRLGTKYDANDTIEPGTSVLGTRVGGFEDLTAKGGEVMDQLMVELKRIGERTDQLTRQLNEGLLHERNLKNIEETLANLKTATESFKETANGLDAVVDKTAEAVDGARGTMKTADAAAADLRLAIADFRKTADAATRAINSTSAVVRQAAEGDGALGTLINDKQMAEDLKALAANLRRSGVLFYRNRPLATPAPATPNPRRR
jgi:phospholipid/cholesterol/gamma-HCH transport system substrate-binding protein